MTDDLKIRVRGSALLVCLVGMAVLCHCVSHEGPLGCDLPEDCSRPEYPCQERVCDDHVCQLSPTPKGTPVPPSVAHEQSDAGCNAKWVCAGDGTLACESPPACGDQMCDLDESCASCPEDCGGCPTRCGNGICESGEVLLCAKDCGAVCGNGYCEADFGESCASCYGDCCPCGPGKCFDCTKPCAAP